MKVRIVKDWDQPDIFRQTPGGLGIWDDMVFTEEKTFNNDVLIVLNAVSNNVFTRCRKGGCWLMSQEPPHPFYEWQTKYYKYYDTVYTFWDQAKFPNHQINHGQTSLPWHVQKSYDELIVMKSPEEMNKQDATCWITSNLNSRPGHELRLRFLDYLQKNKFEFSLFGRGFKEIPDKFTALSTAKYGIAIENFSCPDYWTEKIADCLLSWTMPIYYGCTNITDYFPKQAMIQIDPHDPPRALHTIREAINARIWEKNLSFISESRQLILNKYQFFPAIAERIKKAHFGKKKFYWIPKPSARR